MEVQNPIFLTDEFDHEGDGRLISLYFVIGESDPQTSIFKRVSASASSPSRNSLISTSLPSSAERSNRISCQFSLKLNFE